MATHSSILVWKIPWTEEPGGLQSMGLQRVGHNLVTKPPPHYSFSNLCERPVFSPNTTCINTSPFVKCKKNKLQKRERNLKGQANTSPDFYYHI